MGIVGSNFETAVNTIEMVAFSAGALTLLADTPTLAVAIFPFLGVLFFSSNTILWF